MIIQTRIITFEYYKILMDYVDICYTGVSDKLIHDNFVIQSYGAIYTF